MALGLVLTTATSANAHVVSYNDYVWTNADSSRCLLSYSETSHGASDGGYFMGEAHSQFELSSVPSDCILSYERNTSKGMARGCFAG